MQRKGARIEGIAAIVFIIVFDSKRVRPPSVSKKGRLRRTADGLPRPWGSLAQQAKGSHPCLTTTGFVELRGYVGRALLVCGPMGCAIFEPRHAVS